MNIRSSRILVSVVAAVGVLAVVVAGIVVATRTPHRFASDTAQGVVQRYLSAVVDGDSDTAAGLLAPESPCSVDDLDAAYTPEDVRVVLRDSHVTSDTAEVRVDVITAGGGPLDNGEQSERHTFRLTRTGGDWQITGEPWPMYDCSKEG